MPGLPPDCCAANDGPRGADYFVSSVFFLQSHLAYPDTRHDILASSNVDSHVRRGGLTRWSSRALGPVSGCWRLPVSKLELFWL